MQGGSSHTKMQDDLALLVIHMLSDTALYTSNGKWLTHSPQAIEGVQVKPFLVADAAFPLAATCMKCYEENCLSP